MTRLESGTLRIDTDWTDVSDLVRTVRERIADELAGHEFEVEIEPDLPPVRMDPVLMEQVLYNLLHNAALYTPKGTRVRLVVQRVLCAAESRDDLVLTVMDRGPGLSAEDLARAFDKFHRVNRSSTTGLGLGLSICKGLVEAHGGAISAQNRRSGGLRVTIQLPIEPMPAVLEVRDE
jgi:two-component system sensor histidine kinase KdpD